MPTKAELEAENKLLQQQLEAANEKAKADSLEDEIKSYGLAYSRAGIGMRIAGWPFVELWIGHDIVVRLHARELVRRGMFPVLNVLLGFKPTSEGAIDFSLALDEGTEHPPRVTTATIWGGDTKATVTWAVRSGHPVANRKET